MKIWAVLVAVGTVLLVLPASAHMRSQSYSTWTIDESGQVHVVVTAPSREVTRLPQIDQAAASLDALLARHVGRSLVVSSGHTSCNAAGPPVPLRSDPAYVRVEQSFDCEGGQPVQISSALFLPVASGHTHFARVRLPGGTSTELIFTDTARQHTVDPGGGEGTPERSTFAVLGDYVVLGIEHILVGYDHLAFLLALMLLSMRLRHLVFIVTGFTIGHSITLTLAALGVVEVDGTAVEAMIGFTIALVAAENVGAAEGSTGRLAIWAAGGLAVLAALSLFGAGLGTLTLAALGLFALCYLTLARDRAASIRLRPSITVLFGLIHGFGFAGVLEEIGLPEERLIPALLGFNVGVEIGQLAVVVAVAGLVMAGRRFVAERSVQPLSYALSAVLCGLGLFWFVGRAFAG